MLARSLANAQTLVGKAGVADSKPKLEPGRNLLLIKESAPPTVTDTSFAMHPTH